ncbi:hypothetical protein MOQ_003181 [Trypanosoma cruzi marinkellei]|uniref:Uncharacterized protein n=1 Tax=Trypanosoma cruzi marinkellei TaxID=85056 RepID=K2NVI1_TRYCR|nr:hypothetical protein MOQ_003181 [Trypanosoma cruzi marinkellei]
MYLALLCLFLPSRNFLLLFYFIYLFFAGNGECLLLLVVGMSSREEVAALMAHGDDKAKISLLKKAVVSVTKEKQLLEQHNKQLQEQMATIGEELARVQDENETLRRKLSAAEAAAAAERKRGHFAASMKTTLKGLSSFVTGTDGEEGGTASRRPKASELSLRLSQEDQEKLVTQNEAIHMQLFDLKKKYEDEGEMWRKERERRSSECAAMHEEVTELRSILESTAHSCDQLNAECTRQAAFVQFCHHFFVLSWDNAENVNQHQQQLHVSMAPSLTTERGGVPPREVQEELAIGTLKGVTAFIRTLMSAVSVLVASLRDSFSTQMNGITLSEVRCYRERLSTLLEVHGVQKTTLLFHLKELEDAFTALAAPDEKLTQIHRLQGVLISGFNNWLGMICENIRLLVDACKKVGSHDPNEDRKEIQAVVESTTLGAVGTIAAIRGSLEALHQLCENSCTLFKNQGCESAAWLLALERFWWEGCGASLSMRGAVESLRNQLRDISTSSANSDHVRAALQFMCNSLEIFAARAWCATKNVELQPTKSVPQVSPSVDLSSNTNNHYDFASADNRELVAALAATDLAAVCYHTQMNYTLLELAEKQDALANAQQEIERLLSLNQQQAEDAERVREVMETQIRLLSDQIVEFANRNGGGGSW